MKRHNPLFRHLWPLPLGIVTLILGPMMLYLILRSTGVPAAIVSSVVLLVVAKHLGLLAVIFAPVHAFLRRRFPRNKSDDHNSANQNPAGKNIQ